MGIVCVYAYMCVCVSVSVWVCGIGVVGGLCVWYVWGGWVLHVCVCARACMHAYLSAYVSM